MKDTDLESHERDPCLLSKWFEDNKIKMNEEKCHLLIFGNKDKEVSVNICGSVIKESTEETLLGVTLTYAKTSQKLHALNLISTFMDIPQLALTMTSFIMYHFSYWSFVWMFHDRKLNNKINKIRKGALRIICKDNTYNFVQLLTETKSVSFHQQIYRCS